MQPSLPWKWTLLTEGPLMAEFCGEEGSELRSLGHSAGALKRAVAARFFSYTLIPSHQSARRVGKVGYLAVPQVVVLQRIEELE